VFEEICPGEEFLPKAPNPEDIIYDDDGSVGAAGFAADDTEDSVNGELMPQDGSSHELNCAPDASNDQPQHTTAD